MMKTSERRAHADRAHTRLEQLESEIKSIMVGQVGDIGLPLDEKYVAFQSYSQLRQLNDDYKAWKKTYEIHADNSDLVTLVGQSEHDILREHCPDITSQTVLMPIQTGKDMYLYEHQVDQRLVYTIKFERTKSLPFAGSYHPALDIMFVRVDEAGLPI